MPDETIMTAETETTETQTEETQAAESTEAKETTKETTASTPPPVVNPDGTLSENWMESLPEELRGEESLKVFKDLPNLAKSLVSARKVVGKKGVIIPKENSTPEEWDVFYNAVGRPEVVDNYKVDVPDDLKEIFTDERMQQARERAYKHGASQKQFEGYLKDEMEEAVQLLAAQAETTKRAQVEADESLRVEFGAAYTDRMHVANRLVAEAIPNEETRMEFVQKFGNDPDFIRFASVVGARMVEHKALIATLKEDTPGEAKAKIKALQDTKGYLNLSSEMTKDERQAITDQITDLYKVADPGKPNAYVGMGR